MILWPVFVVVARRISLNRKIVVRRSSRDKKRDDYKLLCAVMRKGERERSIQGGACIALRVLCTYVHSLF